MNSVMNNIITPTWGGITCVNFNSKYDEALTEALNIEVRNVLRANDLIYLASIRDQSWDTVNVFYRLDVNDPNIPQYQENKLFNLQDTVIYYHSLYIGEIHVLMKHLNDIPVYCLRQDCEKTIKQVADYLVCKAYEIDGINEIERVRYRMQIRNS